MSGVSTGTIDLNTNVLVRYLVADDTDEATRRPRLAARKLIESGQALALAKTVILELEWVLRGYYGFDRDQVGQVFVHLLALPQLEVEDRAKVKRAVAVHADGLDFADALHHSSYADCDSVASLDGRGFARRGRSLNLRPPIRVPR